MQVLEVEYYFQERFVGGDRMDLESNLERRRGLGAQEFGIFPQDANSVLTVGSTN